MNPSGTPRSEYPRPTFVREAWTSLNGTWRFAFDHEDRGLAERWYAPDSGAVLDQRITVPFCYQSELSGVADKDPCDVVWYARTFVDGRSEPTQDRLLLHFGAVDYHATVWINGHRVTDHEGGHTPFHVDVTDVLVDGDNLLVVRAFDPHTDLELPRGKQYWKPRSEAIFYTPTTGIWQSVWLEPVSELRIDALHATPDLDAAAVDLEVAVTGSGTLRVEIRLDDQVLVDDNVAVDAGRVERRYPVVGRPGRSIDWQGVAVWDVDDPVLHDVRLELRAPDGTLTDAVDSYFGMRKISVEGDRLLLNDRPLYSRLVLDQGYFPGGLLTAPTDEALRRDVELTKQLGFNGVRKHQKVEDPRFLYWADRLGLLVWGEMANSYRFSRAAVRRITTEWCEVIERDRGHPCIVAWVPINESWGVGAAGSSVRQQQHLLAMYHLTRSLDPTRPVISNDGWEHALTDILSVHDYRDAEAIRATYVDLDRTLAARPSGRRLRLATSGSPPQEPVLLTEFGGVAVAGEADTWGYRTVADGDALLERYRELIAAVVASPVLQGFCYTQLTDVEQEANGLLTFDREPKADIEALREATRQDPPH